MHLEIAETKRTQLGPPAGLLAGGRIAEKPHQGVAAQNATLHQAIAFSKPLTASGLPAFVYDSGRRSRCSGKERDAETGLDFFEARYLSSAQGRFTSPDPYNIIVEADNRQQFNAYLSRPQNWNRYVYAANNPLAFIDPSGLDPISVADCQKDSNCAVLKVNIVLDKNADIFDKDGNLAKPYQDKLDAQVAQAKDEYGSANIALDVHVTTGTLDAKTAQKDAINVLVTDSRQSFANGAAPVGPSGISFVRLNAGTSNVDTLGHEIAHHLTGDTRGPGWLAYLLVPNALADVNNDSGRFLLRNWNTPAVRALRVVDPFLNGHAKDINENVRRWYGARK